MIGADSCQKKIKVMTCDIPKTTVRIGQTRLDFTEARPALNSRASRSSAAGFGVNRASLSIHGSGVISFGSCMLSPTRYAVPQPQLSNADALCLRNNCKPHQSVQRSGRPTNERR